MAMSPQERVVLEGCRRGDEQAWLAVYRTYSGDIGLFLKGMLKTPEVEDLVQRVFLEFLSSLERFRGEAGLRTWLHRIARNLARREIRTQTRRRRHLRAYAETVQASHEPGRQIGARLQLERVQALLAEVDAEFREVWILRELAGFSVSEVAEILEIKAATVRTRHHRARKRLLALLDALESRPALRVIEGGA